MDIWNDLPSGEIELTIESEAYLELAKDDLSKCEYADARKELEVAVRSANPQAEYLLGYLYDHALGVDWDVDKALLWYLRAAEHGYAPAQTVAASLYLDGDDVPANYAEAYRLLSLACKRKTRKRNFCWDGCTRTAFMWRLTSKKPFTGWKRRRKKDTRRQLINWR